MLVLSLFPGIGLLDMAFEEEGFTVVRGPDSLWGGDIKRFHAPAHIAFSLRAARSSSVGSIVCSAASAGTTWRAATRRPGNQWVCRRPGCNHEAP